MQDAGRNVANELLYRDAEDRLELVAEGRPWVEGRFRDGVHVADVSDLMVEGLSNRVCPRAAVGDVVWFSI